jgi:predicted alpha/beta superfamily hydrolase
MKRCILYSLFFFFIINVKAQENKNILHTASVNVHIFDTAFYIPQLKRYRKIWVYLPRNYTTTQKKYPVLYLQDGQNIFDKATAFIDEWGVDECLDSLTQKESLQSIVVAIDNGGKYRMTEYNPYSHEKFGSGEGDQYLDFLIYTLKPAIDKQYRTLPDAGNTAIAGSSMGGLMAYYAAVKYPNVFGKAGIFSPSFWIAPALNNFTDSLSAKLSGRFFFTMGNNEGQPYLMDMENMADRLANKSRALIYLTMAKDMNHNEENWRKQFEEFYKWMMSDGFNYVITLTGD